MITSASIASIEPQRDGRRYVTEIQVDDAAGGLNFVYLADVGADLNSIMTERTAAINAALAAVATVTVTEDDGVTSTLRTDAIGATDLRLTTAQKTALQTAKAVILAVRPFIAVYRGLTAAQQQFVLTHSPWISQVLAVLDGS